MHTRKKVYFAHPISLYKTLTEVVIVTALIRCGYDVVNPGEDRYQREYNARIAAKPNDHPMAYWVELAKTCDECVFSPFPEDVRADIVPLSNHPRVGAGVVKEVISFLRANKNVQWTLPVAVTPEAVTLRPFFGWESFKCLTVEETLALLRASGVKI